ncbi:FAD-dependent oxidoreductase [Spongisporangium articulatum]|uniref:FAD-dependent oxidoreductase n=1 Tax=Spongisporangium articulatum TaxID=3362603 RepID=A0ABW8ASH7_9ACTN
MSVYTESGTIAVIGAGLIGAAAAWQLARRGHRVTLIERATPAHDGGSSHGSARIFRHAYPDPFYAGLVGQARRDWDDLESEAQTALITRTDAVDFGVVRDVPRLAEVLAEVGVRHEVLPARAARERWPQIGFDTDVLWHEGAGVLDAAESVAAMARLALEAGAQLWTDWPVARVTEFGGRYELVAEDGRVLDADRVVVAAGGWLPSLLPNLPLPEGFRRALPPFAVHQEQTFHFPYRDGFAERTWPTIIHKSDAMQVYALPGGTDAGHIGQKVAEYGAGRLIRDASAGDRRVSSANRRRVTEYVERYLPGLSPRPYGESSCVWTVTPTEDFVIDCAGGITVVSACSGHGAKFAPLIGRVAADVATGHDIPARFRTGSALAG